MRETRVEKELVAQIKAYDGWAVKIAPIVSGFPDRMVLLSGGRVYFVELKAPGKKPEPHQLVIHKVLAELGFNVAVLDTPEGVREWVASLHTTPLSES